MEQRGDNLLQEQEHALQEMDHLLKEFKWRLQPAPDAQPASQPNSLTSRWKRHVSVAFSPDGELPYCKRPGACGIEGQLYEMKMAFLVFLRCVNSGCFFLASNLKDTGAFDDLVLKYTNELTGSTKTYFIQLKHKSSKKSISRSELLCLNGDFSLLKYFLSYRDDICVQYDTKENTTIFSGTLDECELILYTNAAIVQHRKHSKDQLSLDTFVGGQSEGFLHSGQDGISYVFTEDKDPDVFHLPEAIEKCSHFLLELDAQIDQASDGEVIDLIKEHFSRFEVYPKLLSRLKQNPTRVEVKKVLKDITDIGDLTSYRDFLQKLKVYHNQSSQSKLDGNIKHEIKKHFETSEDDTQLIFEELMRNFETWWKNGNFYLTENTKFWVDILTSQKEVPYNLSRTKIIAIKHLKMKFNTDLISNMKSMISGTRVLHIAVQGDYTVLSSCKVYQTLCCEPKDSFIFMNWGTVLAQKSAVLGAWHTRWAGILVIEGDYEGDELDPLFQDIANILVNCPRKKLVLITRESTLKTNVFHQIPTKEYSDKINLLDLDFKTQEQILKKSVKFQGSNVPLGELVGAYQELKEMVTEDILIKLARGEKICIGEELPTPISNYIPRMLERKDHICPDIQAMKEGSAMFAVSGSTVEELQQAISPKHKVCPYDNISDECRFIVLNDSATEKDFMILSNKSPDCHWLHKDGNSFRVKQSKGDIRLLRQHIDDTQTSFFMPKTVWDLPGKTVVVTAEPGMGKSTLITYIAKQTKLASPSTWVLHINLNSHTEHMDTLNCSSLNQDQVLQFLMTCARISGHKSGLEEKLFNLSVCTTGRMVVFFDGFDEICPYFEGVCVKILEILLHTRIDKIWITSRTTCINKLETITSSLSFGLTLFSEEEQKQFLKKVWMKRFSDLDSNLIGSVISELLDLVAVSLNDSEKKFAAIPLQTMIISEVYEQHLKESLAAGCVKLPEQLDILELYDGFFRKKFEIYFREKKGDDLTKPAVRKDNEVCWLKTDENHKAVALVELLSQEDLKALHDRDISTRAQSCLEGFKSGTEMTGIIDSIIDGKPHFIHRTFLEYFAAKWFAENYTQNQKLIKNKFLTSDYNVIRAMFDQILARDCKLHKAVMNKDIETVQRLIKTEEVNLPDAGGRTPLHLAAISFSSNPKLISKCKHIAKLLLAHGADVTIVDTVFQWTPLRYADATRAWCTVGQILQNRGTTDDLILTKMNINNPSYVTRALCAAAENGYIELLDFLVRAGIKTDTRLDNDRRQMIHVAAQYGQIGVVEYLLKAGIKLHIRDKRGWTPLHYSAKAGHLDMVKYLLTGYHQSGTGKEVNQIRNGHIKDINSKCKSAVYLVLNKCQSVAIERASNVNIRDSYGRTALHHAASAGRLEVVRYLCGEQGVEVDAQDQDGWTPLHYASSEGRLDAVRYLVGPGGACLNKGDRNGRTAVHSSITRGQLQVVQFLAGEGGADTNGQDNDGWTLLHYAAMESRLDIVQYLIKERGAKTDVRDKLGQTPLDLACGQDIKTYLEQISTVNR